MKAGKNTPHSVLRYIDTIWRTQEPTDDPITLAARELHLSDKQLAKLKLKYGDGLLSVLHRWWNETREHPRFMARQAGNRPRTKDGQYVETAALAIDDAETVPEEHQAEITNLAHARWDRYMRTERQEETTKQELRKVTEALREVALMAAKAGVDVAPLLESLKAQIVTQRERIERKAA